MKKVPRTLLLAAAGSLLLAACSINQLAVRAVAGMLSGGGDSTVFTGEDDPQLVGDALPFALKLYESLLEADPGNPDLLLATGRTFVMYANAFVQTPADMLPDTKAAEQAEMRARAGRLYFRGREYVLKGIELRRPGFRDALFDPDPRKPASDKLKAALAVTKPEDIDYLFWAAAAWLAEFTTDPFNMELLVSVPQPLAMIDRVLAWNDAYGAGSAHDILISFYGSAPADLGGSEPKARTHFERSIELSKGLKAGPYVALASSVSVRNQNAAEFRDLLGKALAIDVNKDLHYRLENVLAQQRAQWLLKHIGDFFLSEGGTE